MSQYAGRTAPVGIVFDGQSLNDNPFAVGTGYARTLASHLGYSMPLPDTWIGGAGWNQLNPAQPDRILRYAKVGTVNVGHLMGGTTELSLSVTGATIYSRMVTAAQAMTAAGFGLIVAATVTASDQITAGAQETERADLNSRIMADASNAFGLSINLCPTAGVNLDNYASACFIDQTHWSNTGRDIALGIAEPLIVAAVAAL